MNSTPAFSKAVALYKEPQQMDKDRQAIKDCGGTIIETPELILWGIPHSMNLISLQGNNVKIPRRPVYYNRPDAWFIWLCAGDVSLIPAVIPYPLEWVVFARRNRLRAYKFRELVKNLSTP